MNLVEKLTQFMRKKRISLSSIYDYVWSATESDERLNSHYLINIAFDEETRSLFAVFSSDGNLYRSDIGFNDDGTFSLSDLVPVKEVYESTQRSAITLKRTADGIRVFLVAGTSVLNRVGEIDSNQLFDNMIRRAEESKSYPTFDFHHLGPIDPAFEFGKADFLAREGNVYIASGLIDEKSPLGPVIVDRLEENSKRWGCSIEFVPISSTVERINIGADISVNVYTDGVNTRISFIPNERQVAHWFTSISREVKMSELTLNGPALENLRALFNDDEEFQAWVEKNVTSTNRSISTNGYVHRETETEETDDTPEVEESQTETTPTDMEALTAEIQRGFAEVQTGFDAIAQEMGSLTSRIEALENAETEQRMITSQDIPERLRRMNVVYRPTQRTSENDEGEQPPKSFEDRAQSTLSKLPNVGFNGKG